MSEGQKRFLCVNRTAPHGTITAQESLEVVLIGAAFEQDIRLAFVDDGVFQLVKGQNTAAAGLKNFAAAYRALGDYDIRFLYVEAESLAARGLTAADLMVVTHDTDDAEDVSSVHIVSRTDLTAIMAAQDVIFSF
jgi:tRNA 2-thiouridine synthesizing protein C